MLLTNSKLGVTVSSTTVHGTLNVSKRCLGIVPQVMVHKLLAHGAHGADLEQAIVRGKQWSKCLKILNSQMDGL